MKAEISGLTKPVSASRIVGKSVAYVKTMADLGKPVSAVTIQAEHYDAILRAVNVKRGEGDKYDGLRIGDIAVVRA